MIQETFPMTVGEEEVRDERELLTRVEDGLMMDAVDSVRYIILHCSATRCNCDYTVEQLLRDHRTRGFRTIGYLCPSRWYGQSASSIARGGGTLPSLQPVFYRSMLRRRTGRGRAAR